MDYDDLCWVAILIILMVFARAYVLQNEPPLQSNAEGFRASEPVKKGMGPAALAPLPREEAYWLFA